MAEATTRTGGCHCGKVRFEAKTDLSQVIECNCSICSKAGYLLAFVPVERFTLLSGDDGLADYQFGKRRIHHVFCASCGIHPFARGVGPDGREMRAINVRCLEDVDPTALTITPYDGRSV